MGRKKNRPIRSGSCVSEINDPLTIDADEPNLVAGYLCSASREDASLRKPFFIDIDPCTSASDEHFDVAEVALSNVTFFDGIRNNSQVEESYGEDNYYLRFRLSGLKEGSCKLGNLPLMSADSIQLECVQLGRHNSIGSRETSIIFSGLFDGPEESISGLVHLVSLKFMGLRLKFESIELPNNSSIRIIVEIMRSAFDACKYPFEVARQPWRKSMMSVMVWLRPEVTASEVIYGRDQAGVSDVHNKCHETSSSGSRNHSNFDITGFYEAIKPSKEEPILENELSDLLPCLRPYQRRAVYWMVAREKGTSDGNFQEISLAPFSIPVTFLRGQSMMFYNPFNGNVSWHPLSSSYVSGGILADEMGLGKTVELLACIFANFKQSAEECITDNGFEDIRCQIRRPKRERVECICGAATESLKFKGLWVQCDICDAWQHADCVGFSPGKKSSSHDKKSEICFHESSLDVKGSSCVIDIEEQFVCFLCTELMEAAKIKISTGATLIVCPAPIQAQWYSEIIRHTRPGSLKIYIYEGARNITTTAALKSISHELATAAVVLTTYDVLREDLSHDSDRQDGDRHFLRFQKRYPVIPTLITRVYWWRVCLDEAQMVECNTASVTEMAIRLHAHHRWCITGTPIQRRLDDLFGLVRFLRASPFDSYRWWVEVIRDPYERKDKVAMDFIHKAFKQIMWRSSKNHVADELQLPPQEERLLWLSLSPVEEHFYQKQHETCVRCAQEIITGFKSYKHLRECIQGSKCSCDSFLSHDEVAKLLCPLLKLRQACCHPQVGSSGLCSLQNSPLTMEEILEVLIGKSKIEGEEALRRVAVALNGLAGLALIEEDNERAVSLYKEALTVSDENSDDYRLDPLLSVHIHHNLAELLSLTSELPCPCIGRHCSETNEKKRLATGTHDQKYVKRRKNCTEHKHNSIINGESLEKNAMKNSLTVHNNLYEDKEHSAKNVLPSRCYAVGCLRETCENIKQKYLSSFISKLFLVQQEFRSAYKEVCNLSEECKLHNMSWWIQVLEIIEEKEESSNELMKKIEQAIARVCSKSRSFKVSSGFRNIKGLKYTVQVGLDSLMTSREALITPLLQIDQTMENPDEAVLERISDCPYCSGGNGKLCIHCELGFLFQKYEAKLFLVRKAGAIASLEEALDHQKRKYELNSFFRNINTYSASSDYGENKQRQAKENIEVSRHPSELEITLGVIKSYTKANLGRQGYSLARKHLLLFEALRREFAQASLLSYLQAKLLGAHDELRCSTSRLRLKQTEDEPTAINILRREDLIPYSLQFSSDKFLSLSLLSRMKGQLRYLKGLVKAKVEIKQHSQFPSSRNEDIANGVTFTTSDETGGNLKADDDPCPICHEKLDCQKMVFECGHLVCCKCYLHLTEEVVLHSGKWKKKWLMCPTCRQRTDMEHVAYVDEKQNKYNGSSTLKVFHAQDMHECSIAVKGSYGTKIEAVTRRILAITSTDERAKILVFSNWNDVLDVLQHALDSNNVSYVRMKGGRKSQDAIAQFKGERSSIEGGNFVKSPLKSKNIQVLLILIQHGSNGLNLLEAQHVILVEPLLNAAVEAQAIGRVHRIGQDKKTFVHRFIVKNTVEESIYKLNLSRSVDSIVATKPNKKLDQPILTVQDVKSLFPSLAAVENPKENFEDAGGVGESLRHLPPAAAATAAAERRLVAHNNANQ